MGAKSPKRRLISFCERSSGGGREKGHNTPGRAGGGGRKERERTPLAFSRLEGPGDYYRRGRGYAV